ncbi:hypothetical protein SAMN02745823_03843 [Sporobacter termitidis DSM 10068]|uniref:Phage transcriptional regulator, ArpU family n=2 Tax=Sporobacter TaxID=44748 RepID=A0A1M5ZJZ5_9FIRM|nr:hypothetical protein SAMN02745823_03843 [Sporobacter termitidis DSM 10068]
MTAKQAATLIDYASGPVPSPTSSGAIDTSRPHVTGGGRVRPSRESVEAIYSDLEEQQEADERWAQVFDELIERCETDPDAKNVIEYGFRLNLSEEDVCKAMDLGKTTYYNYRAIVLAQAAVLAVRDGLMYY